MPSKIYSLVGFQDPKQKLDSTSDVFELRDGKPTFYSQATTIGVEAQDGDELRVFWSRALTCIIAPILVTGYYVGLWSYWMSHYDAGGPVPQGPPGGRWAYYTW